jgi:hypothetical protein
MVSTTKGFQCARNLHVNKCKTNILHIVNGQGGIEFKKEWGKFEHPEWVNTGGLPERPAATVAGDPNSGILEIGCLDGCEPHDHRHHEE